MPPIKKKKKEEEPTPENYAKYNRTKYEFINPKVHSYNEIEVFGSVKNIEELQFLDPEGLARLDSIIEKLISNSKEKFVEGARIFVGFKPAWENYRFKIRISGLRPLSQKEIDAKKKKKEEKERKEALKEAKKKEKELKKLAKMEKEIEELRQKYLFAEE